MIDALVIGAGPAGLMAAEQLASAGRKVVLAEAKPSVGRKFLMAGKSGLNLTMDQPFDDFLAQFGNSAEPMRALITEFDNSAVQEWARGLGQPVFTGSTGRVFPKSMKSSPLLRAWMGRLGELGVELRVKWRWQGWQDGAFAFSTPEGEKSLRANVTVLALGGASWSRLGSNGAWAPWLAAQGVEIAPFTPANVGLCVDWSDHMERFYGTPVKGVALSAGNSKSRGEFVVSRSGLEGGGIYTVSSAVRQDADLFVDLMPDWSEDKITEKRSRKQGKNTLSNHLRKSLRLDPVKIALLMEFGRPLPAVNALAKLIKSLPIKVTGTGPIDGAISTAGGVAWGALDDTLMLRLIPGVFAAGEMLDWEAPTGGYLVSGCLASGRWAGKHAADWR